MRGYIYILAAALLLAVLCIGGIELVRSVLEPETPGEPPLPIITLDHKVARR